MFCTNCGNEVGENEYFCGKCGNKVKQEGNFESPASISKEENFEKPYLQPESESFRGYTQNGGGFNDVIEEDFVKGNFKWGGGAIAWLVIMIIWNSFSVLSSILSAFVLGGMSSAMDFSKLNNVMSRSDIEFISSIFDTLVVFLVVGIVVAVILLIGYSALLGKKKKSMFYLVVFGYSASSILSIVQAFVFSDKVDKISRIFRDIPYSTRKNFQAIFDMYNGTLWVGVIFGILISAGLATATYFIIRKNWNRLA